jgi:hypothetical protein
MSSIISDIKSTRAVAVKEVDSVCIIEKTRQNSIASCLLHSFHFWGGRRFKVPHNSFAFYMPSHATYPIY